MPEFDYNAALAIPAILPAIDVSFGFYIYTGDGYSIEDNLREREDDGIRRYTDEDIALYLRGVGGRRISTGLEIDSLRLENNGLRILRNAIDNAVRPEGHGDTDLMGTCWVTLGSPAWLKVREWADNDEPYSTGKGDLCGLHPGADEMAWDGVSEMGQTCLELAISFFDLDEVKKWIAYEDGDGPPPQDLEEV